MWLISPWARLKMLWPCRHEWWTVDEYDELWGAYEFLHCRKCDDWKFVQIDPSQ